MHRITLTAAPPVRRHKFWDTLHTDVTAPSPDESTKDDA